MQQESDLFSLPDIQMGQMIGESPHSSDYSVALNIVRNHFGEDPIALSAVVNGRTNHVFIADTRQAGYTVLKMRDAGQTDRLFQKAAWGIGLVKNTGIPVPQILEIGFFEGYPFMMSTYMSGIPGNVGMGDTQFLWYQLGRAAGRINSIATPGRLDSALALFDTGEYRTFDDYLNEELNRGLGWDYRRQWQLLSDRSFADLRASMTRIQGIDFTPHLVHRDLVPRNVKVNDHGDVVAILDWDTASAHLAPQLELANSFEDRFSEEQGLRTFLQGYGISFEEYNFMQQQVRDLRRLSCLRHLMAKLDENDMVGARTVEEAMLEFWDN